MAIHEYVWLTDPPGQPEHRFKVDVDDADPHGSRLAKMLSDGVFQKRFELMRGYMNTPAIPGPIPIDGKDKACMWDDAHPDFIRASKIQPLLGVTLPTLTKWCKKGLIRYMEKRGIGRLVHIGDSVRHAASRKLELAAKRQEEAEIEASMPERIAEASRLKEESYRQ